MSTDIKRFASLGALTAATLLVVGLAIRHRALANEFRDYRMRVALPQRGNVVPTFRTVTAGGDSVTIGEAPTGERQLLFVLTKRCPYCRRTLPVWKGLAAAVDSAQKARVRVFAIALDSLIETAAYLRMHGLSMPVITFPARKLARLYRAVAVPQTLVLDSDGTLRYAHTGLLEPFPVRDSVLVAALAPSTRNTNAPALSSAGSKRSR